MQENPTSMQVFCFCVHVVLRRDSVSHPLTPQMQPRRLQVWPVPAAGSVMCGERSCRPAAGAAPAEKALPAAALCGAAWGQLQPPPPQQQPPRLPAVQLGSQPTHPPTDLQEARGAEEQEAVGGVLPALTLSMPCTAHTQVPRRLVALQRWAVCTAWHVTACTAWHVRPTPSSLKADS